MKEKGKLIESPESQTEEIISEAGHAQADLLAALGLGLDWKEAAKRCSQSIAQCEIFTSTTESHQQPAADLRDAEKLLHYIQLAVCDPLEAVKGNMPTPAQAVIQVIDRVIKAERQLAELREAESPRQADRTPQDYAIEHGGYLADAAQAYLDEKNRHDMAVAGYADEVPDTDSLSDHHQALRNAIYEFRKRAEKSREVSQHPVPAPVLRCWKCNGTLIYKRTEEGFTVCTCSCKAEYSRNVKTAPNSHPADGGPSEIAWGEHPGPAKGGKQ